MPETLTPVTQHLAVWDVQRDAGWIELFGEGREPILLTEIDDRDDFVTIVSMLSDRDGLCFDVQREVLRRVERPAGANGHEGDAG